MPRVIIWSECQYTKLALKEIISSKLPYVNEVISYDHCDEVNLYAKDYLIIDPSGGGFHRCYEFLRENLSVLDPERILIMSSAVDMLMLELLLKKEFKFLKKKNELPVVVASVEQFIQLQGTTLNKEAFNYNITRMEEKVLVMMMSGLSVTSISNILKLSVKTVSVHKCNSLRKIGVDANSSSALFFLHKHAVGNRIGS
ncbi:LuxR family transcriptional regulator [Rahnella variigena]|jgi:DNA-binding CsgD family transcriptional regulator|uniref:helix-turn-helix transcriptional regulator n=2 Tax=Rahnella TaxID=34037 RepID=UPI000DEAD2AD|nr:helix-turn-helix transcriptional regulator [Rahnella sp. JUb53]RBQ33239.1 LuxR family transcriptional regulator [Rahnella aquatilis]RYJ16336.1 LuxR family transcriptional regulator [Rahnella variigena]TCQ90314.1 DNA-binding NarL/FixJ family response regulator [Rahnella sp. JUb53]